MKRLVLDILRIHENSTTRVLSCATVREDDDARNGMSPAICPWLKIDFQNRQ